MHARLAATVLFLAALAAGLLLLLRDAAGLSACPGEEPDPVLQRINLEYSREADALYRTFHLRDTPECRREQDRLRLEYRRRRKERAHQVRAGRR